MLYKENPFYILDASLEDNRRTISRLAEEKAFLSDSPDISEARAILTNPQRRISAEVHWFPDCSREEVAEIKEYISETISGTYSKKYSFSRYCYLTQLNIALACVDIKASITASRSRSNKMSCENDSIQYQQRGKTLSDWEILQLATNELLSGVPFDANTNTRIINVLTDKQKELLFTIKERYDKLEKLKQQRDELQMAHNISYEKKASDGSLYIAKDSLVTLNKKIEILNNSLALVQSGEIFQNLLFTLRNIAAEIDRVRQAYEVARWKTRREKFSFSELEFLNYVLDISNLYEKIDSSFIFKIINEKRTISCFPPIQSTNDVDEALYKLQQEIRQILSQKLQLLPLGRYVEFITVLAEDYSGHYRYLGQKVLEDAISEYRLFSNDLTKKKEDSILKIAGFIKQGAKSIKVDDAVSDLIKDLKEWDRLAQPLQLYEMAKGRIHTDSEQILNTLRDLAISLHNDHELTDEAIKITDALIEVFKELPEYSELLTDDKAALAKIKADNDITNAIISDLNCLEAVASEVSSSPESVRQTRIDTLLSTMKKLDGKIKANISDPALRNQLREKIAYLVRSVGISLHNEKHDSQSALSVISAARNEFADISDLYNKFSNDIITLNREISQKRALEEAQKKALEEKKKAKKRKIIAWIIIFIVGLYFYISSQNSSSKKPPSKSIYSSSSSLVAQTMPENGHVFYCSEKDRPSSFKVTNNGSSNYYMKFVKVGTKSAVIRFFVRAYSTAYINMPAGYYELRYAYGSTWYGEKDLFGAYTKYAKDEDTYDFSSYEWEISLFTSNSTGNTMDVQSIDADEF